MTEEANAPDPVITIADHQNKIADPDSRKGWVEWAERVQPLWLERKQQLDQIHEKRGLVIHQEPNTNERGVTTARIETPFGLVCYIIHKRDDAIRAHESASKKWNLGKTPQYRVRLVFPASAFTPLATLVMRMMRSTNEIANLGYTEAQLTRPRKNLQHNRFAEPSDELLIPFDDEKNRPFYFIAQTGINYENCQTKQIETEYDDLHITDANDQKVEVVQAGAIACAAVTLQIRPVTIKDAQHKIGFSAYLTPPPSEGLKVLAQGDDKIWRASDGGGRAISTVDKGLQGVIANISGSDMGNQAAATGGSEEPAGDGGAVSL